MEAVTRSELYSAQLMNATKRKSLALEVITSKSPLTKIAEIHQVSHKFLYGQKNKAISAIDDAFLSTEQENEVLF